MKVKFALALAVLTIILSLTACNSGPSNSAGTQTAQKPGAEQAVSDAIDVYIYGYPLVTMDMTRRVFTNVVRPGRATPPWARF